MIHTAIHFAPEDSVEPILGRTLPSLLDEACDLNRPTPAVAELTDDGEVLVSAIQLRENADALALAMLDKGLVRGDRVMMVLPPGIAFTTIDFACQIAGLIDIPLYTTARSEDLEFIIDETEAMILFVGSEEAIKKSDAFASQRPSIKFVVKTDFGAELDEWIAHGKTLLAASPDKPTELRAMVSPHDVATLIYTSGTTGRPKGVQLTHENLTFNGLTGLADMQNMDELEVAISMLPLAHVFQRTLHYAVIARGWPIHFVDPLDLKRGFAWAKPTMFAAVPRVLEKIREGILRAGGELTGSKRHIFDWAMALAESQDIERTPSRVEALQLAVADKFIFSKWREFAGGRLRTVVCGGASLNPGIANFFGAWNVDVLQGFGLTETSTIVTFNRRRRNRAGTVGHPLPGVEVAIADDGEILTRGPHVTKGYFKRPDATAEAIDPDGWFHTGDIGEFDTDGFLSITDRKKNLFKLSTGRYIAPQPMEVVLTSNPLINHALIVGADQKFVVALLFPELETLRAWIQSQELDIPTHEDVDALFKHAKVLAQYQALVDLANADVSDFHCAKRFTLINADLTVENGMLTPTMKTRRAATTAKFQPEIDLLYAGNTPLRETPI